MLANYLATNSTLREIEDEFEAEYIPCVEGQEASGQRRSMVQGYYAGLDFSRPQDARKFLNVLSVFMARIERQVPRSLVGPVENEDTRTLNRFVQQLSHEGYSYKSGAIAPVSAAARLSDAKAIVETFDGLHMAEQIHRIEASIDTDPALAIGTAKELVESCFKTILRDRGVDYGKDDLPQLGRKVFKALNLTRDDIPDSAKGAETIKTVLSNLATIVQGVAELRSLYGTGHGKDGRTRGVSSRHARLAVGAASALVTFVFQTHQEHPVA